MLINLKASGCNNKYFADYLGCKAEFEPSLRLSNVTLTRRMKPSAAQTERQLKLVVSKGKGEFMFSLEPQESTGEVPPDCDELPPVGELIPPAWELPTLAETMQVTMEDRKCYRCLLFYSLLTLFSEFLVDINI